MVRVVVMMWYGKQRNMREIAMIVRYKFGVLAFVSDRIRVQWSGDDDDVVVGVETSPRHICWNLL